MLRADVTLPTSRQIAEQLGVIGLYVVTGWMGLALAIPPGNVTPVWLPGGIALAAVLVLGVRVAPGVFAGAALLNALFYTRTGSSWLEVIVASGAIAAGSTLQALAGRALLERFAGGAAFLRTPRGLITFALVEIPACVIAASVGLAVLLGFEEIEPEVGLKTWLTWWMGDYVGVVLVAPLVLALRERVTLHVSLVEAALHASAVLLVVELIFAPLGLGGQLPAPHFLLPVFVAVAYRLGPRGASVAALLAYLGAALGTAAGRGPFAGSSFPLLATDGLLFALALPTLLLAVAEEQRRVAACALRDAQEQLEQRVAERTRDLARANDELGAQALERARFVEQVERAQRVEATGRLAGGMAHDFNNFLTIVISATELLRRRPDVSPPAQELATTVLEAAHHAADLTRQLLVFAGRQPGKPREASLDGVLRGHLALLRPILPESIELHVELASDRRVRVDATQIGQLLVNLALNARDAMPTGGAFTVSTRDVELTDPAAEQGWVDAPPPPGPYAVIEVRDTGAGMSPEVARLAFEPFFTTKRATQGSGLGLASVHGIVRQANGAISLHSEPSAGTRFRIYLPSADLSSESAAASRSASASERETPRFTRRETRSFLGYSRRESRKSSNEPSPIPICAIIRIVLRFARSARCPAGSAKRMTGSAPTSPTNPSAVAECVR